MQSVFVAILITCIFLLNPITSSAAQFKGFDSHKISEEIAKACETISGDHATIECLNQEILKFMKEQLQPNFREGLQEQARKYNIVGFNADFVPPLWELYRVQIPLVSETQEPQVCVDLYEVPWALGRAQRKHKLQDKAKALVRAALFTRRFSVNSFGRPFSPLLEFYDVNVCDYSFFKRDLYLDRENKVLKVATTDRKGNIPTADHLYKEWDLGNAVNPRPHEWTPVSKRIPKAGYLDIEQHEHMDYTLYINWEKINPVGDFRILLRALALNISYWLANHISADERLPLDYLHRLRETLQNNNGTATRVNLAEKLTQYADAAQTSAESAGLLRAQIVRRLVDPNWVGQVMSKHFAVSARLCTGTRAETNARREQKGFVNFANNKLFAIDVDFETPFVAYDATTSEIYQNPQAHCAATTLNNEDVQSGGFNFSLIDNLAIRVAGLGQLTDALLLMPQIALYEALSAPREQVSTRLE